MGRGPGGGDSRQFPGPLKSKRAAQEFCGFELAALIGFRGAWVALVGLWWGFGGALGWLWWSLGVALVEPWGGFRVALEWLWVPNRLAISRLWCGLGVALYSGVYA